MNIAVLTLADKNITSYSRYTLHINQSYCNKYGYCYIQYNQTLDSNRPVAWSKILAVKKHINDFDWIFYIDADAIFFNHDIKIENILDTNFNLILAKTFDQSWMDIHYPDDTSVLNINTGVFLIKGKNSWSSYLLDEIYSQTSRINHHWWENQAFSDIYNQKNMTINSKIKILDQHQLNGYENMMYSYKDYSCNQYILHWAGIPNSDRETLAKIRYQEFWEQKFSGDNKKNRFSL